MCDHCGAHGKKTTASKLAVTGKGGVGKTTITALLANALQKAGRNVLLIDADPNSNLLSCMGYAHPETVPPLIELKELIEERTGVKPGTTGGFYKLNPEVDDIPDKYAVDINGIKVLVAGGIKKGGSGCYCPENAFVRAMVAHLLLDKDATLILDMEAGIEHLSRGTVEDVDRLLVVVEPSQRSVETALRIKTLAADLGLKQISAVANKIQSAADMTFLKQALDGMEFIGSVPFDEKLRAADIAGQPAAGASRAADDAAARIVEALGK